MFWVEAILSIEFEIPLLHTAIEERMDDIGSLKDRLEQLEALSEAQQRSF